MTGQQRLELQTEPSEAGFDPDRLARIDRHFERYVKDGRLPGWQIVVSRGGKIVHLSACGERDKEAKLPVEMDTLFRIYSMTKPITSVAAMILYEEGAFELTTPVSQFIPSFERSRVYLRGPSASPLTAPATEPVRIWHLLSHTSGLSYGFLHAHAVDETYRVAGYDFPSPPNPPGVDLAAACDSWAALPLLFQPGTAWNYSQATDVLGRVIEVASGLPLDRFLAERVFRPLRMIDTAFWVTEERVARLAALYAVNPGAPQMFRDDVAGGAILSPPSWLSGGGGLVSTAADYLRFAHMLLGRGELDGTRLLGPHTVHYMTQNHLPGGGDVEAGGHPLDETSYAGVGFGLGFSVVLDPVTTKSLGNRGEFGWGGAASTIFWVDPVDEIVAIFMTQLMPSTTYPLRSELRQLVYQALVD